MNILIFLVACVILLCVFVEKFSDKFGMPALIFFMFIGMLFGCDGILKIPFDDFQLAENICSIALIFIMFYGGFNTKWQAAKNSCGKIHCLVYLGGCYYRRYYNFFMQNDFKNSHGRKLSHWCGTFLY